MGCGNGMIIAIYNYVQATEYGATGLFKMHIYKNCELSG